MRLLALLVLTSGAAACITATPPKTPNQRAVERAAPPVTPPAPETERPPRPAAR